jgi:hypothetical protein
MPALTAARHISITGQFVTFDRYATGWVATGWQQGLPVARRPIAADALAEILNRFDPALILMTV